MTTPTDDRLIPMNEVCSMIGVNGASSVYSLIGHADPKLRFPKPVKIGTRSRWLVSEVREWLERQTSRRQRA